MTNKLLFNRSGMSPEVTCRKGRHAIESIVSRFSLASLICLCMLTIGSGNVWGTCDFSDDFSTVNTNTSYSSRTTTAGWTAVYTAVENYTYSGNSYRAFKTNGRNAQQGVITSPVFSGGCASISFVYGQSHKDAIQFDLKIYDEDDNQLFSKSYTASAPGSAPTAGTPVTETITGVTGKFYVKFMNTGTNSSNGKRVSIFNVCITKPAAADPALTVSKTSITSGLTYSGSGPSVAQTFTVSGTDLTANVSVSAPTNFEVSLNGSSYAASQTITASGTLSATTVYVRLKSGLAVNSYSGNITVSSTNATSKTVALSGSVTAPTPTLTRTPTSLSWGTVNKGASLSTKTFSISGTNLTSGSLTISATGGYSVSPASVSVSGTLAATTITVTPPSTSTAGTKNGTITISGGGATSVTVSCSLTVSEIDQFIDEVQSTSGYTSASPHVEAGSYGTTPTLSDKTVATSGTCEQQHYHFVGWITAAKYTEGTAIAVGDLQTPTSATGETYYAVWAKQGAGSGSATGGITQAEVTSAASGKTDGSYGSQSASSASGNWTGNYAFNTQNSKRTLQINATSGRSIISPTFSGAISNIAFVYTSNSSSNKTFTLKDGDTSIGTITATANTTEGSGSASISGTHTSFTITANNALYIHSITVTYSSVSYEEYIAKCCTELGTINGSIKWSKELEDIESPNSFNIYLVYFSMSKIFLSLISVPDSSTIFHIVFILFCILYYSLFIPHAYVRLFVTIGQTNDP